LSTGLSHVTAPPEPRGNVTCPNVAFLDENLVVREANDEFVRYFAGTAREVVGQPFAALFHPTSRRMVRFRCDQLVDAGGGRFTQGVTISSPGRERRVQMTVLSYRRLLAARVSTYVAWPDGPAAADEFHVLLLEALAEGTEGDELAGIAERLSCGQDVVGSHLDALMRAFGAGNRTALVARAYSTGVLDARVWPPRVRGRTMPWGLRKRIAPAE
jgi:DNA-binding CsgD family transcriptional regulator